MYRRILVPLDGSKLAEQVIPYVRFLAKDMGLPVHLVEVVDGSHGEANGDPSRSGQGDRQGGSRKEDAQAYLQGVERALADLGVKSSVAVHEGSPAQRIEEEAEKEPSTLVAMCTHGRSGIGRWLMGSVTDKALHAASSPFLIARARSPEDIPHEIKLGTVIVPLDGSKLSEEVLPHVASLAGPRGLRVLAAMATPSEGEYYRYMNVQMDSISTVYTGPYEEFSRKAEAEAMEYLHQVREDLLREGLPRVEERLLHGHPAEAIIELARQTSDSLVAMTTHGRSGLGRWVLGSVTDRVVQHSGGPVLVIRPASP